MPTPKFLQCLSCMQSTDDANQQNINDADLTTPIGRGFSRRQIAKGVAVVLSGYDSTTAAASVGTGCDSDTVDLWVQMYRPSFFEDGMQCPPALILWWIKELDRKDQLALQASDPNQMVLGDLMNPNGPSPSGNNMRLFYPSTGIQPGQQCSQRGVFGGKQQPYMTQQGQIGGNTVYVPAGSQQQQGPSAGQYSLVGNQGQSQQQPILPPTTGQYSMVGNQSQQPSGSSSGRGSSRPSFS